MKLLAPLVAAFSLAGAGAGFAAAADLSRHAEILVALRNDCRGEAMVRAAGGRVASPSLGIWRVPGRTARMLLPALKRRGAIRYAEPSFRRSPTGHLPASDALSVTEIGWHLYQIGAERVEPPGPGFPLTLIDSGLDLAHPEFAARPDTTALNPQSVAGLGDEDYHGTVVASTAAAPLDGVGAVGVYPRAALRVYDLADLSDSTIVAAIETAVRAGPSVINLSFGGPEESRALYEATLRALKQGSLVVASSGNEFDQGNPVLYPASYPHVLTVAATGRNDDVTPFSSGGASVDLAAPGDDIPVLHPTNPDLYLSYSGTSFSAPMVAAAAAWLMTAKPELRATQVFDLLRWTAKDVGPPGFDERTGFGRLDLPAALTAAVPAADPQEPNDAIDQITAAGMFGSDNPPIGKRLAARLDDTEDPADVYRVRIPARRTVTIDVAGDEDLAVELHRSATARLAASDRAGRSAERVVFRNRSRRPVVVFLRVAIAEAAEAGNAEYSVSVGVKR